MTSRTRVDAHDVSILFQLPKPSEKDALLSAKSSGARGELLPSALFAKIPTLALGQDIYGSLRVTSARIDPCAGALSDEGTSCKNQLRLTLQPLIEEGAGATLSAVDASVHAIYALSRDELKSLVGEELAAKSAAGGYRAAHSLGVHPILAKQGANGTFGQALATIIVKYAGAKNLSRIAFMTREPSRSGNWTFGTLEVKDGETTAVPIPTLGDATTQNFQDGSFVGFRGKATPMPKASDGAGLLLDTAAAFAKPAAEVARAFASALRIENPTKHSPATMDCVSCHTTHARLAVAEKFSLSEAQHPDAFVPPKPLGGASVKSAQNLHSFSYLGDAPAVSQRAVNETAAVVDLVNTRILGRR